MLLTNAPESARIRVLFLVCAIGVVLIALSLHVAGEPDGSGSPALPLPPDRGPDDGSVPACGGAEAYASDLFGRGNRSAPLRCPDAPSPDGADASSHLDAVRRPGGNSTLPAEAPGDSAVTAAQDHAAQANDTAQGLLAERSPMATVPPKAHHVQPPRGPVPIAAPASGEAPAKGSGADPLEHLLPSDVPNPGPLPVVPMPTPDPFPPGPPGAPSEPVVPVPSPDLPPPSETPMVDPAAFLPSHDVLGPATDAGSSDDADAPKEAPARGAVARHPASGHTSILAGAEAAPSSLAAVAAPAPVPASAAQKLWETAGALLFIGWVASRAVWVAGGARLERHEVGQHPLRRLMLDHLREHPGSTAGALAHAAGIGCGRAVYHLAILEREQAVRAKRLDGRRRFFVYGAPRVADEDVAARDLVRPEKQTGRVLGILRRAPGTTLSELARLLGMSPGQAHYHVSKLDDVGFLYRVRSGRRVRHYLTGQGHEVYAKAHEATRASGEEGAVPA